MQEHLVAVGSPALVGARHQLNPCELAGYPLLQPSTRPYLWRQWFESLGIRAERDLAGPRMELFSMLSEAAVHGLGICLLPRFLIEEELASGALIQLTPHSILSDRSYYLIVPDRKTHDPALAIFRSWIEGEARRGVPRCGDAPVQQPENRPPRISKAVGRATASASL
jgi:LysR family glycine cleavage system transcriptional activator